MTISRRQFVQLLAMAGAANIIPQSVFAANRAPKNVYDIPKFGNARVLHFTDCHAQLLPVYFREPNVNIGLNDAFGVPPHLVGKHLLKHFKIPSSTMAAHGFTYLEFVATAKEYGKVGGFAHLATLIKRLRNEQGSQNTILLDGGDTWQGSGTAYWTNGNDMVGATNLLGVDCMTGHWEFTYQDNVILENIKKFKGEFLAQNIKVKDEAIFEGVPVFDEDSGHAFKPYTIKNVGGVKMAIIGQSFPYTPIANPKRFIPNWTFGINDAELQTLVNEIRENEKPSVVVLLSHNGMDVDIKMASKVTGIDAIMGGHTHDGVPKPMVIRNSGGKTLVTNAGSNGKFLAVLDFKVKGNRVVDYRYKLLPIFSNLINPDKEMAAYIKKVRAPFIDKLTEKLAVTDDLLYRRGNFNGTFDQLICDALREENDTEISFSPGFRWGTTVLPGESITMEHVMDQTAITYPETNKREMTGKVIKDVLEDVADNLFNKDPYRQQGGDMVRIGGMNYVCDPTESIGKRITGMTLDNGKTISANKKYKVAGWASVNDVSTGRPIWDVVADYLRLKKTISVKKVNTPKLKNVEGNPGVEDYLA
ncbi:MAG: thiosulfohydrolase SoxB [Gammaproteobacteria bacterium]|nr:thiosulfohydrolase SoxB [Gammaproteobacteria bacterium]